MVGHKMKEKKSSLTKRLVTWFQDGFRKETAMQQPPTTTGSGPPKADSKTAYEREHFSLPSVNSSPTPDFQGTIYDPGGNEVDTVTAVTEIADMIREEELQEPPEYLPSQEVDMSFAGSLNLDESTSVSLWNEIELEWQRQNAYFDRKRNLYDDSSDASADVTLCQSLSGDTSETTECWEDPPESIDAHAVISETTDVSGEPSEHSVTGEEASMYSDASGVNETENRRFADVCYSPQNASRVPIQDVDMATVAENIMQCTVCPNALSLRARSECGVQTEFSPTTSSQSLASKGLQDSKKILAEEEGNRDSPNGDQASNSTDEQLGSSKTVGQLKIPFNFIEADVKYDEMPVCVWSPSLASLAEKGLYKFGWDWAAIASFVGRSEQECRNFFYCNYKSLQQAVFQTRAGKEIHKEFRDSLVTFQRPNSGVRLASKTIDANSAHNKVSSIIDKFQSSINQTKTGKTDEYITGWFDRECDTYSVTHPVRSSPTRALESVASYPKPMRSPGTCAPKVASETTETKKIVFQTCAEPPKPPDESKDVAPPDESKTVAPPDESKDVAPSDESKVVAPPDESKAAVPTMIVTNSPLVDTTPTLPIKVNPLLKSKSIKKAQTLPGRLQTKNAPTPDEMKQLKVGRAPGSKKNAKPTEAVSLTPNNASPLTRPIAAFQHMVKKFEDTPTTAQRQMSPTYQTIKYQQASPMERPPDPNSHVIDDGYFPNSIYQMPSSETMPKSSVSNSSINSEDGLKAAISDSRTTHQLFNIPTPPQSCSSIKISDLKTKTIASLTRLINVGTIPTIPEGSPLIMVMSDGVPKMRINYMMLNPDGEVNLAKENGLSVGAESDKDVMKSDSKAQNNKKYQKVHGTTCKDDSTRSLKASQKHASSIDISNMSNSESIQVTITEACKSQAKNAHTMSPKNACSASPKSACTGSPRNACSMSPKAACTVSPKKVSTLSQKNTCTMSPKNACAASPKNATSLSPRNACRMSPKNVFSVSPKQAFTVPPTSARAMSPKDTCTMSTKSACTVSPKKACNMSPINTSSMSPITTSNMSPRNTSSMSPRKTSSMSPRNTSIMSPRNTSNMSPGNTSNMSPRNTSNMSPRNTSIMSPRNTSNMSPGNTSIMSPRNTSNMSPRNTSNMSQRNTSSMSPRNTSNMSPRNTSNMSPRKTSNMSPRNTSIMSPGNTSIMSPRNTSNISPRNTSNMSPRNTSNMSPGNTSNMSPRNTSSLFSSGTCTGSVKDACIPSPKGFNNILQKYAFKCSLPTGFEPSTGNSCNDVSSKKFHMKKYAIESKENCSIDAVEGPLVDLKNASITLPLDVLKPELRGFGVEPEQNRNYSNLDQATLDIAEVLIKPFIKLDLSDTESVDSYALANKNSLSDVGSDGSYYDTDFSSSPCSRSYCNYSSSSTSLSYEITDPESDSSYDSCMSEEIETDDSSPSPQDVMTPVVVEEPKATHSAEVRKIVGNCEPIVTKSVSQSKESSSKTKPESTRSNLIKVFNLTAHFASKPKSNPPLIQMGYAHKIIPGQGGSEKSQPTNVQPELSGKFRTYYKHFNPSEHFQMQSSLPVHWKTGSDGSQEQQQTAGVEDSLSFSSVIKDYDPNEKKIDIESDQCTTAVGEDLVKKENADLKQDNVSSQHKDKRIQKTSEPAKVPEVEKPGTGRWNDGTWALRAKEILKDTKETKLSPRSSPKLASQNRSDAHAATKKPAEVVESTSSTRCQSGIAKLEKKIRNRQRKSGASFRRFNEGYNENRERIPTQSPP